MAALQLVMKNPVKMEALVLSSGEAINVYASINGLILDIIVKIVSTNFLRFQEKPDQIDQMFAVSDPTVQISCSYFVFTKLVPVVLVPVFANQERFKEDFYFHERKKKKMKLFYEELL